MNPEQNRRVGVAILAKAPIAGLAKTRLIPHLGAEAAAALQGWLLRRTLETALAADIGPVSLWCAPELDHPEFARCRGTVAMHRQPAGDLGERMHAAVTSTPTTAGTLLIGTDCPLLTPELLRLAAASLLHHDATVIPADDGGYVLIGMRKAARQIFNDVDWSTDRVMAQTRARLTELNWQWSEFAALWDVDRSEDFERLANLFPEVRSLGADSVAPA